MPSMMSTFDLILLGSLISLGGIGFLVRGYWRPSTGSRLETAAIGRREAGEGIDSDRQRAEAMAGVRWLTVGALALFIGHTRGAESGYLFNLWTDVFFHVGLLSVCWAATAFRLKHAGFKATIRPAPSVPQATMSNRLETAG